MKRSVLSLLLMSLPLAGGCTQPWDTYQHATVQWRGATACFSVADTNESRHTPAEIAAISVSQYTGQAWIRQWSWVTPLSPPTILDPSDCIPYGYTATGETGAHEVSPALTLGVRYGVLINGEIPNPSASGDATVSRRYSRQFCLRSLGADVMEIVLVPRIRGALDWSVCPPPSEPSVGEIRE